MPDTEGPSNTVNLAGTMPSAQANGLLRIADDLVTNPGKRRIAIVEFDALKRVHSTDADTWQAIVRFRQIEPVEGEAAEAAEHLLRTAQDNRLREEAAERGELTFDGAGE